MMMIIKKKIMIIMMMIVVVVVLGTAPSFCNLVASFSLKKSLQRGR